MHCRIPSKPDNTAPPPFSLNRSMHRTLSDQPRLEPLIHYSLVFLGSKLVISCRAEQRQGKGHPHHIESSLRSADHPALVYPSERKGKGFGIESSILREMTTPDIQCTL
ncbi:hypothetical protein AVEN_52827-1 [Araneus ventricosus]|uniref:Uncharacterized protein n=1 Tax=Araneus ventricosus TaxID=182803 RepID=A0A4Y2VK74_ARAVE|nr:hypothetical protein AVEN_52827-1 [Araneus ventricosus]